MVPHTPIVGPQEPTEWYFLVEKPGFDVALMGGINKEMPVEPDVADTTS